MTPKAGCLFVLCLLATTPRVFAATSVADTNQEISFANAMYKTRTESHWLTPIRIPDHALSISAGNLRFVVVTPGADEHVAANDGLVVRSQQWTMTPEGLTSAPIAEDDMSFGSLRFPYAEQYKLYQSLGEGAVVRYWFEDNQQRRHTIVAQLTRIARDRYSLAEDTLPLISKSQPPPNSEQRSVVVRRSGGRGVAATALDDVAFAVSMWDSDQQLLAAPRMEQLQILANRPPGNSLLEGMKTDETALFWVASYLLVAQNSELTLLEAPENFGELLPSNFVLVELRVTNITRKGEPGYQGRFE